MQIHVLQVKKDSFADAVAASANEDPINPGEEETFSEDGLSAEIR